MKTTPTLATAILSAAVLALPLAAQDVAPPAGESFEFRLVPAPAPAPDDAPPPRPAAPPETPQANSPDSPAPESAAPDAKPDSGLPAGHKEATDKLANEQDELAADAQQLAFEQTHEKVIELLEQVGEAMDDATDRLGQADTGGETIAAQTDVIEKIYEAAKERQKQCQGQGQGQGQPSAMMEMLERMMGKTPGSEKGKGQSEKPGDKGGEGMTGKSDSANSTNNGNAEGKTEQRRVPKAAGTAGRDLPPEFRKALDAFNRGASNLAK